MSHTNKAALNPEPPQSHPEQQSPPELHNFSKAIRKALGSPQSPKEPLSVGKYLSICRKIATFLQSHPEPLSKALSKVFRVLHKQSYTEYLSPLNDFSKAALSKAIKRALQSEPEQSSPEQSSHTNKATLSQSSPQNKAVVYARVSSKKQLKSSSLATQSSICSNMALSINAKIIAEFVEVSSAFLDVERPKLKAALSLCRLEKATLICASLCRLSRNQKKGMELLKNNKIITADNYPFSKKTAQTLLKRAQSEVAKRAKPKKK